VFGEVRTKGITKAGADIVVGLSRKSAHLQRVHSERQRVQSIGESNQRPLILREQSKMRSIGKMSRKIIDASGAEIRGFFESKSVDFPSPEFIHQLTDWVT